ncbi:putative G-protein coupled receptor Mth-like 11 [Anticarsia gemmatalis]|uniref:putative G-protein coupled receptor Mth-like 11 n=1 Tax=Anticarsia gemmatalis TaxID=129554 RepID=UPI003F75A8E3
MQFTVYLILFVFFIYQVKSYSLEDSTWSLMNYKTIKVKDYCANRNCVAKCCPDGQIIATVKNKTGCITPIKPEFIIKVNYTNHLSFKYDFVQNDLLSDPDLSIQFVGCKFRILEDGSLRSEIRLPDIPCRDTSKLQFCIGFKHEIVLTPEGWKPDVVFMYSALHQNDPDAKTKTIFSATGMLISAFFMMLVLLVCRLIPELQNFKAALTQAYLLSLTVFYILKPVLLLNMAEMDGPACQKLSPAVYYFFLASFLWLNVMSFDLWYAVTNEVLPTRKNDFDWRTFRRYCVYAWGSPALVTIIAVIVDRQELFTDPQHAPPFRKCFAEVESRQIYMDLPIGLLIGINMVLVLLTAKSLWLSHRNLTANPDSRSTQTNKDRFRMYGKMFVIMGISWALELLSELPLLAYIIVAFFNIFIGIFYFYIFVCNKRVYILLCKRFNIENKLFNNLDRSMYTGSEATRGQRHRSLNQHTRNSRVAEIPA